MPINIFLTEGQNLMRKGLKLLLETECDVNVVGEARDGFECLNEVNKSNPNIAILDADMRSLDGIKTLKIMREQEFNVKTLMLAEKVNADMIVTAMESKCDGFLLKNCEVTELKKAIYSIYNGETYIQEDLQGFLDKSVVLKNKSVDKLNELTRREIEVLKLLAEGLFNKEIAVKLNISERTVKNHVSNIFKKIQVNDRTQAAVFAIKNKLIML